MCGRNGLNASLDKLKKRYKADHTYSNWQSSFNIAPSSTQPVVKKGSIVIEDMDWNFIPGWTDDTEKWKGKNVINARIEGVHENNLFKQSFREQQALIPSTGFYEWKKTGKSKVPYRVFKEKQEIFSMAGFHSQGTFCILTKKSPTDFRKIHDRIPVILKREDEIKYLNRELSREELLSCSVDSVKFYQVSKQVNNPDFDNEKCIERKKTLDSF